MNSTNHVRLEWIGVDRLGDISLKGADGADGAQGPQGPTGQRALMGQTEHRGPRASRGAALTGRRSTGPSPTGAGGKAAPQGAAAAQRAPPLGPAGSMPVVMEMTVTASGGKYNVNTVSQGTIVLYRGFTYTFDLSSTLAIHPFKIGTSSEGNEYTSGMSTTGSMLTFTVPLDRLIRSTTTVTST